MSRFRPRGRVLGPRPALASWVLVPARVLGPRPRGRVLGPRPRRRVLGPRSRPGPGCCPGWS